MLLLFFIYIAFIGLGLPDSLFGTAWPAIYQDMGLPFSYGSFVTSLVYLGTMISSMTSAKLINRIGTGKVTAISTLLTALAMLGYSSSHSFILILLCALPLGLGAGAIDTALNNYVAIHYSARHMNFLHCFYGIGITISPYILAKTMSTERGWSKGYFIAFIIQLLITVLMFIALPIWKKQGTGMEETEEQVEVLSLKEIIHTKGAKAMWSLFFFSCAIECTCGSWGSTYLVERIGMVPESAATKMMFYFIGVAAGRFISGVISKYLNIYKIISICMCVIIVGVVTFFVPIGGWLIVVGLFLIGFGNGPLFPNFNYITPILFGENKAPSIIGSQMTVASLSFMIVPILFGQIARFTGLWVFPVVICIFVCLLAITYISMQLWILDNDKKC